MQQAIIEAINDRRYLVLSYDGFTRFVEPNAFGYTKEGHGIVRSWQVQGGSVHKETVGWKPFRTGEIRGVQLSETVSAAPRRGYKRGDSTMTFIYAQI